MNKFIIGVLVIAMLGIGVMYMLPKDEETIEIPQGASAIVVSRSFHDFGDIDIFGGKVQTTYTLKNTGQEDIIILSAITSCMCTEGEIDGLRFGMHESSERTITIPAGEEKVLTAIYDRLAQGPNGTGRVTGELMIKTNTSETP